MVSLSTLIPVDDFHHDIAKKQLGSNITSCYVLALANPAWEINLLCSCIKEGTLTLT